MWIWIIIILALLIGTFFVIGCRRVDISRRASLEGIEDNKAVKAYNRISRWPQFRLLRRMILREIRAHHPEGIMVDVGSGPGYLVSSIAKSLPLLRVIGVDISNEMVKLSTRNIPSPSVNGSVEFRQGDIQELPFGDNSVDFVVSTLSLHHWSEPQQALQEIHRILKPGGQFLIFDLRRDARRLFYWLLGFAQRFVVPAAIRRIGEPTGSATSSYTPVEAEALLAGMSLQEHRTKPGFGWMFIWGRKGR